jgi:hypothetical protein
VAAIVAKRADGCNRAGPFIVRCYVAPRMGVPPRDTRTFGSRTRLAAIAGVVALVGLLAAAVADAALPAQSPEARLDRTLLLVRIGLAILGLTLFADGVRRRRRHEREAAWSLRRVLLGATAVAAFATNFNLFVWTGLHRHELYHYYLGSKYFPELGYFGLYVCSVQAAAEDGFDPATLRELTDLRSKERRTAAEVLAVAPACRESFAPERWSAFRADVGSFRAWMGDPLWIGVLRDHGYNPSPAWTLFGRSIASIVPATPDGLWQIAKIDTVLLIVLFGALAAVFGFDVACIAAIAWGACGHARYQWTGDAFLRQLWLTASMLGLAALYRGRAALGGALLAVATLERVFPGAFLLGFGARELVHWARNRRSSPELWRFVAGASFATILVVGLATWVAGRGVGAWREFGENTRGMLSFTPRNALGLDYALSFTMVPPPEGLGENETERGEIIQSYRRRTLEARAPWRIAALALFGALFAAAMWRGVGRAPDGSARIEAWEAAALGAAAVPFLTVSGSYYLGFVLAAALLAKRRWRIGAALLLACAAWSFFLANYGGRALAFAASSWVLLALSLWMLVEAAWAPPESATRRLSRF